MDSKIYSVYKHTAPNGKVYIGITKNDVKIRWKSGYGYKQQRLFWRAIQKYGWDNIKHEVLVSGLSADEAKDKEVELILSLKSNNPLYGYNVTSGGDGTREYSPTDKTRHKIRMALIGNKMSEESKRKMSESQRERFKKHPKGKSSNETRKLISEKTKGRKSPNLGKFGYANKTSKEVAQYSKDGKYINKFGSGAEAERCTGICCADISKCCRGKRKSAGGYVWRLVDDCKEQWVS